MLLKPNVLEVLDKMNELVEASKLSMEKHTISPDQLYKNLEQLLKDIERVKVMVNREPDK